MGPFQGGLVLDFPSVVCVTLMDQDLNHTPNKLQNPDRGSPVIGQYEEQQVKEHSSPGSC